MSVTFSALKRVFLSFVGPSRPQVGSDAGSDAGYFSVPSGFAYHSTFCPPSLDFFPILSCGTLDSALIYKMTIAGNIV